MTLRGYVLEILGYALFLTDSIQANVLIDQDKHARLADFGLLTIAPDTNLISPASFIPGGTWRWMSPELFDPGSFGLKAGCPTKRSDCYALGMVTYEVLSGKMPFYRDTENLVVAKVLRGERPGRPRGAIGTWFTNEVWGVLESCWEHTPKDRPRIGDVLQSLENASKSWIPTSQTVAGPQAMDPPTGELESNTEEPTDGSESPSQGDSSRSPRDQSKGDPDENNSHHPLTSFQFSITIRVTLRTGRAQRIPRDLARRNRSQLQKGRLGWVLLYSV